jgi:FkbM family methyltransferase
MVVYGYKYGYLLTCTCIACALLLGSCKCADAFFVAKAATSSLLAFTKMCPEQQQHGGTKALLAVSHDDDDETPGEYAEVLRLLRLAWSSGEIPKTSLPRAKLILGGGAQSCSFLLANPRLARKGGNVPAANARFPELARAVFALEDKLRDDIDYRAGAASASCAVNCNAAFVPHVDSGAAANASLSYIVGLGTYQGGDLVVEGQQRDIRYAPLAFDGWRQQHWTQPFTGERFTLVWFTATAASKSKSKKQAKTDRAAAVAAQEQAKEDKAAAIASQLGIAYRSSSTDVQAIIEVLGDKCYLRDDTWSPHGHEVLDAGAHIGCFSRYALDKGAMSVRSFEPEPSNAALARRNADAPHACLVEAALVNSNSSSATLVLGRQRNDGAANTWRHALEDYNTYAGDLETRTVRCLSFYDILGNATFVKMDIEGAELAILDTFERGVWRNVRRLVFEYSFTKRRSLPHFRRIVQALEREGFTLSYDFKGTLDELEIWPGRTDALVFCSKD